MGLRFTPNGTAGSGLLQFSQSTPGALRFGSNPDGHLSSVYTVDWDHVSGMPADFNDYLDFATTAEAVAGVSDDTVMSPVRTAEAIAVLGAGTVATQAEAEAATNNTKMMTPLRVAQEVQGATLFSQTGAGAANRTVIEKLREVVSITDFGASTSASGAANVTAINKALLAANVVYVPPGTFDVASAITLGAYKRLFGAGKDVSILRTTSATADVIVIDGGFAGYEDIGIKSSVVRSAGKFTDVTANASQWSVRKFRMDGAFYGIACAVTAVGDIEDGEIVDTVITSGVSILVNGGYALRLVKTNFRRDLTGATGRPFAHISIANVADITIDDCEVIGGAVDLNIAPGNGQTVGLVIVNNSQFDDPGTNGIRVAPTGTGVVNGIIIDGKWQAVTGSSSNILLTNAGGGTINGARISGALFTGNGSGIGIEAVGVSNLVLTENRIGSHTTGISLTDCLHAVITGNRLGATDPYSANTNGLVIAGTSDYVVAVGNDCNQNTNNVVNSASGTHNVVHSNDHVSGAALAQIAAFTGTGFPAQTGATSWAQRSLANAAAGITWTNPAGVAGNPTPVLANDLAALEGLASTGIARRTGTDAWSVGTTVSAAEGGTGLTTYAVGDLIYASATTPTLSKLAAVAVGSLLASAGVNTAPAWSASPTLTTSLTVPLLIGGSAAGQAFTFQTTSGVGSGDSFVWKHGNNGATTGMTFNATGLAVGAHSPGANLHVKATAGTTTLRVENTSGAADFAYAVGTCFFTNNGSGDIQFTATTGACAFFAANTEVFRASSASLCIGTTSPLAAWVTLAAGTTAKSQIRFASSTAPTSPADGDFWFDGTNVKIRVAGATKTFTIT